MLAPTRPLGRSPRVRRPPPITETVGPFKGMRTTMLGSRDQGFAEWLYNCFPSDPVNGGELVVRPGRTLFPSATSPRVGEGEGR